MPWGRERGAGVSPLCRGCPATAPQASPPVPQAWPGLTARAQCGTETRARMPCGHRAPRQAPRYPLFLGVPKPALAGCSGHCLP